MIKIFSNFITRFEYNISAQLCFLCVPVMPCQASAGITKEKMLALDKIPSLQTHPKMLFSTGDGV